MTRLTKNDTHTFASPGYSVPPVVRAIKVLRYIAAGGSVANQSRAAREIGINRTTLLRILHTLEAESMLERRPGSDDYKLGTGIIELAGRTLNSLDVTQVAQGILRRMASELGLSCHLGLLQGRDVLYAVRAPPDVTLLSNIRIGTRMPAHASSMGRAILASMPREAVDELYRGVVLIAVTPQTPTTLQALHLQLDETRKTGFVDARSAYEAGIDSIAAPVLDMTGEVVAAINSSGPASAFTGAPGRREAIVRAVLEGAAGIGRKMGYSGANVTAVDARHTANTYRE
jgi:DNA-binding IclR family transcriptional regulator